ncbi:hypothetical protein [Pontibacillus salipaludis]|uniref:Uncharacterized protein n=1 Tax=Pontibacillus salipaludis TaxID=1697394 RepID=A0ABQ1Q3L9_9BACI|nr:hypothetical protein [Pontibacillus salipaludis]GGD11572.1 hypothetical protein GCM10011389_18820 [Pontibacillus salipaludis]
MWTRQRIMFFSFLILIFIMIFFYAERQEDTEVMRAASEGRAQIHLHALAAGQHLYTALHHTDDEKRFLKEIENGAIYLKETKVWTAFYNKFYRGQIDRFNVKEFNTYLESLKLDNLFNMESNHPQHTELVQDLYEQFINQYGDFMYGGQVNDFEDLIQHNYETKHSNVTH